MRRQRFRVPDLIDFAVIPAKAGIHSAVLTAGRAVADQASDWRGTYCGVWILFFVSLALYDRKTLRRIHPVTAAGFAWFVLAWIISATA